MRKYFTLLVLMTISSFVFGQTISLEEASKPLQKGEVLLERVFGHKTYDKGSTTYHSSLGCRKTVFDSREELLRETHACAMAKYPTKQIFLRNLVYTREAGSWFFTLNCDICEKLSGDYIIKTHLSKAFDKSLMNVREGSRFSIDNVTISGDISGDINKESVKDNVIDVLLDKGYKVVAKEYLERLYQEQQVQQSGIYNENTVVQENNLSAVGYFLNIKITDESLRVQVVNVSTGEYEGNATITF